MKDNARMVRKRSSRKGVGSRTPVGVMTVPVAVRPNFSVPIEFSFTSSGTVTLPPALANLPWRVCTVQCTLVGTAVGSVLIRLFTTQLEGGGTQAVSCESRAIPVGGGIQQVLFRNSRHVSHGTIQPGKPLNLATIELSGANIRVTGLVYVSFLGALTNVSNMN